MDIPFFSAGDGSFGIVPSQTDVRVVIGREEKIVPMDVATKACLGLEPLGRNNRINTARVLAEAIFRAA